MRQPPKQKKINIITIEEPVQNIECFDDLEFLPDHEIIMVIRCELCIGQIDLVDLVIW